MDPARRGLRAAVSRAPWLLVFLLLAVLGGALWLLPEGAGDEPRAGVVLGSAGADRGDPRLAEQEAGDLGAAPAVAEPRQVVAPVEPPTRSVDEARPPVFDDLRGRVVDELGEPVIAFEVRLSQRAWQPRAHGEEGAAARERLARGLAFRDPHGRFVVERVPEGSWSVEVSADGYLPARSPTVALPASIPILLELTRCGSVSVEVVDLAGAPVVGAEVYASTHRPRAEDELGLRRTDEAGRATLPAVRLGAFRVLVRASGYAPGASERMQLTGAEREASTRVVLGRGGRVVGELRDVDGAPAAGVHVVLDRHEMSLREIREVALDGSFAFERIPAGRYELEVSPSGGQTLLVPPQWLEVEVSEGETTVARFEDLGASHVRLVGRVLRDASPLPRARVDLEGGGAGLEVASVEAQTDADGRFEVTLPEEGPYRARIQTSGSERGWRSGLLVFTLQVPPVAMHEIELAFETGTVVGRVLDPDGVPVPGATAVLVSRDDSSAAQFVAQANAQGHYEIDGVAVGTYVALAGAPGTYGPRRAPSDEDLQVDVVAGEVVARVDLRLPALYSIEGVVTHRVGGRVGRAKVQITGPDAELVPSGTHSDLSGGFRVGHVPRGSYWLRATWRSTTSAWVFAPVTAAPPGPVELVLEPGAMIFVRLESAIGPAARSFVEATDSLGRPAGLLFFDENGVALGPLPAGTYTVRAGRLRGPTAERVVALAAGEERTVTLRLDE